MLWRMEKANRLRIFHEIEETGEALIVTDHNRPVLRIQPIAQKKTVEEAFGNIQGKVTYREDINTPTADEWGGAVMLVLGTSALIFWTRDPGRLSQAAARALSDTNRIVLSSIAILR